MEILKLQYQDPVGMAIDRLRQFEPPEGYLLQYSGGKDSDTVLDLLIKSRVKFDIEHGLTTLDAPETIRHVLKVFERLKQLNINCNIRKSVMTAWSLLASKTAPPNSLDPLLLSIFKRRWR